MSEPRVVAFTGRVRNPGLFLETLMILTSLQRRGTVDRITFLPSGGDPLLTDAYLTELKAYGVELLSTPLPALPARHQSGVRQVQQLAAVLSDLPGDAVVFKTRPDTVASAELVEWLFDPARTAQWATGRIWLPWIHPTYPFLLADHNFAGTVERLRDLCHIDDDLDDVIAGSVFLEPHVRRYAALLEPTGLGRDLARRTIAEAPAKHLARYRRLIRIQGDVMPALHLARLTDERLRPAWTEELPLYWRGLREHFALAPFELSRHSFVDRLDPGGPPVIRPDNARSAHAWCFVKDQETLEWLGSADADDVLPAPAAGGLDAYLDGWRGRAFLAERTNELRLRARPRERALSRLTGH